MIAEPLLHRLVYCWMAVDLEAETPNFKSPDMIVQFYLPHSWCVWKTQFGFHYARVLTQVLSIDSECCQALYLLVTSQCDGSGECKAVTKIRYCEVCSRQHKTAFSGCTTRSCSAYGEISVHHCKIWYVLVTHCTEFLCVRREFRASEMHICA